MKTKLNELLEFPCTFTYKVMGLAQPELVDQVIEVVQRHAPGDYSPQVKPSSKGSTQARIARPAARPFRRAPAIGRLRPVVLW